MNGIAFHRMLPISGQDQHVFPQAVALEVYDVNISADLQTNV